MDITEVFGGITLFAVRRLALYQQLQTTQDWTEGGESRKGNRTNLSCMFASTVRRSSTVPWYGLPGVPSIMYLRVPFATFKETKQSRRTLRIQGATAARAARLRRVSTRD